MDVRRGRPISYSESAIYLEDIQRRSMPLISPSSSMLSLEIECPSLSPSPSPPKRFAWAYLAFFHRWALQFTVHLILISIFETVFFWKYVSESEDQALINLVNHYIANTLVDCANMTVGQRTIVTDFLNLFLNQTVADGAGLAAAADRSAANGVLLRNSWLYVGGLVGLCATLTALAKYQKMALDWRHILGENIALVTLLGLYEWMFFHTVIFRYQSISFAELDQQIVDELHASC